MSSGFSVMMGQDHQQNYRVLPLAQDSGGNTVIPVAIDPSSVQNTNTDITKIGGEPVLVTRDILGTSPTLGVSQMPMLKLDNFYLTNPSVVFVWLDSEKVSAPLETTNINVFPQSIALLLMATDNAGATVKIDLLAQWDSLGMEYEIATITTEVTVLNTPQRITFSAQPDSATNKYFTGGGVVKLRITPSELVTLNAVITSE